MHDKILEDHDSTKCKVLNLDDRNKYRPGECCGTKVYDFCSDNYEVIWGGKCGFKNDIQHYKMWCIESTEE